MNTVVLGPECADWTRLSKTLHRATVAFVVVQYVTASWMERAFDGGGLGAGAVTHIGFGLLILLATGARLADRLSRGRPPYDNRTPNWAAWTSRATHAGLYATLLAMPLAGSAAFFLSSEQAAGVHSTLSTVLLLLAVLHIAGALAEHFWFKSPALKRMLGR